MNKFKCLRCNQYQYSASDVPTACIRCGSPTVLVAEDVKLAEETEKMRSHFGIEGAKRPLTRNQWFKLVQGSYVPVMKEAMEAREEDNVCNVFPHSIGVTYICREGKSAQEEFNQILNAKALVEEAKMKFNFNDYKGKYVMHCKTKEDAKEFCILMHEDGRKWRSYNSYIGNYNWDCHKMNTCYNFNNGEYSAIDYYIKNDYTILEWVDFKEKKVETINHLSSLQGIKLDMAVLPNDKPTSKGRVVTIHCGKSVSDFIKDMKKKAYAEEEKALFEYRLNAYADAEKEIKEGGYPDLPVFIHDVQRGYKHIYHAGMTIAIPRETIVGIDYKHPNDKHNPETGEALAYFRMEGQEESRVWFDEVCSTTEQWKPKQGERYWYISSISEKGVSTFRWENDNVDNSLLSRNLVFKTKEEAIAKTRELGWVE